jgi:prepilin-type N-terminal cleavage/methylation domain-containing protein
MRGFSLIELLVVIMIFTVISTVILANHSKFNSSVLLGNVAYDIALSLRQAQVYGLSTQQFSGQFQLGYGIHFSNSTSYILFADIDKNRRYDSMVDSAVQTYTLGQGHSIQSFCGVRADGSHECSNSASPITHLDIGFLRPNPDASLTSENSGEYSSALITVQSASGETRSVSIQSTGQISVPQQ